MLLSKVNHGKVKKNKVVNVEDTTKKSTATGTKRRVEDSELTFNHYLNTLMTKKV